MFQDPTSSTIRDGWRTNPVLPDPLPSEGVLLVSGPSVVDVSVESDPFVISFYGTIRGTLAVTLAFTGVSVTPSDTSVELTAGSPSASVTVTPAATGSATVTASCSGLADASYTYTVQSPLPVPDMDIWAYKLDPESAWGSAHGVNDDGDTIAPKINLELTGADTVSPTNPGLATGPVGYKLNSAIGTYDGSAGSPSFLVEMTASELRVGRVTPTFAIVKRIADPGGGGFTVFKHTHDRDEHWWDGAKWRTQFMQNGNGAKIPWGTQLWFAFGFRATEDQVLGKYQWNNIMTFHQGSSSLISGGGMGFWLTGGNGIAANARLSHDIVHYQNPNWPNGTLKQNAFIKTVQNAKILTPVVGDMIYLVGTFREGCGYADPEHGNIYGTLGAFNGGSAANGNIYFVKVWYALNAGLPVPAVPDWHGHWGSPHNPTHANADNNVLVDGVLTNRVNCVAGPGMYHVTDLTPASVGTQRTMIHRGVRVWKHQDGMTQNTVLTAFRGS